MKNREMAASFFSKRSEGTSSASSQGGQKHRPLPWVEKVPCCYSKTFETELPIFNALAAVSS